MVDEFCLLETILYTPTTGFYLLEHHLLRLQKAIHDFQLIDPKLFINAPSNQDIINELNDKVPLDDSYHRVRLLLDTRSKISVEHTLLPTPEYSFDTLEDAAKTSPKFTVVLDTEPFSLPTDDPYVLHKTTKRDMYDISRTRTNCHWHGEKNEPFDVILWNSNREITETSITNLAIRFIENGKPIWKTPKISSGLLPGVFRAHLLKQDPNIVEDSITIDDLKTAQKEGYPIICFNSVRKAYRVELFTVGD